MCGPGSAAGLAGDEVVGEQEDSGSGDGGEPAGGVERSLPGVVELEERGGHAPRRCLGAVVVGFLLMESWSFLTNHARVVLRIAQDPGARLRDIAAAVGITERSAYGIVTDLTVAGFVVKHKDGRRNRYQIQAHLPLPEPASQEPAIGDVLAILIGDEAKQEPAPGAAAPEP